MGCCKTCFSDCRPLDSCFTDLIVYTPVGQEGLIDLVFENGQSVRISEFAAEITNGFVTLGIEFPEGFFSPYGGPYTLKFYNSTTGQLIEFTAIDGKLYDCIQFEIVNSLNGPETAYINVFSNAVPTPDVPMNTEINIVAIALNEQQNQNDELTFLIALQNL